MIRNTNERWGWPSIALHWLVAVLVLATFVLGLWASEVPARADRPYYYAIHASLGITLLVILVARIVWGLLNPTPAPAAGTPAWQEKAARLTHLSLYAISLAVVLLGWLLAGLAEPPIVPQVLGLLPLPAPVTLSPAYEDFLEEAHELSAFALVGLAAAHALAGLWHHYVLRDQTLRRMLGSAPRSAAT